MRLSFLSALAIALALGVSTTSAAELKLVRVWHAHRTAEAFTRISEYFTGQEDTREQTVLRTHPDSRDGYYFLARVENPGPAIEGARLELRVITPASPDPKTYAFDANLPAGSHVIQAGLTGTDWPASTTKPVAWHFRLVSPNGVELVAEQSFLWSSPSATAAK